MNERLRSAIANARVTIDGIAQTAEVDPKTVQRWIQGRTPHARHRWIVSEYLKQDDAYLWPEISARAPRPASASDELLSVYGHRADAPTEVWTKLYLQPRENIDLMGYAILFLHEQDSRFTERITDQADNGCAVRIVMADPTCDQLAGRDQEEELTGGLIGRVRTSLKYFRPIVDHPNVTIRLQRAPMYNSTFRFDDEMLVTPHLYRVPGYRAPMLHLRRLHPDGAFSNFLSNFEAIWAETVPVTAASSNGVTP